MTNIFIRAVKSRLAEIARLKADLPAANIVLDQFSNNCGLTSQQRCFLNFEYALKLAGQFAAVHMEDDVELTSNFHDKLSAEIVKRPDVLIQFFSIRPKDLELGSRWDNNFLMGQCFYVPPTMGLKILTFSRTWTKRAQFPGGPDLMVRDFLKAHAIKYWLHVPSLVQHKRITSARNKKCTFIRQSPTFIP